MDMIFNELSLQPMAQSRDYARAHARIFVETMRTACQHGIRRQLRTQSGFSDSLLANNYTWRDWIRDSEVPKELRQYFLTIVTRAPFLNGLDDLQEQETGFEFAIGHRSAEGLGATYLMGDLAISLLSEDEWDTHKVTLKINELLCDGSLRAFDSNIHHASRKEHIAVNHKNWIKEKLSLSVTDGTELWERSPTFFPSLLFCSSVQDQMVRLPKDALPAILRGLFCLEEYCRGWQSGGFNQNLLGCASSSESEATRNQYREERTFLCQDGTERFFNYHVKPGRPWRIHYDPSPGPGRLFIGYVGEHLRTVRHNH
ncbi:MAG: hypothetical protein HQL91_08875 [Magnetococcales bacterium]|nr:hypothetical protein [Magnetococcales bacterium]